MKKNEKGVTAQDTLENQSDYVENRWYVVREATKEKTTEKVFFSKSEAEECFKERCQCAKEHYSSMEEYPVNQLQSEFDYVVERYCFHEDVSWSVCRITMLSFKEHLTRLIHDWMEETVLAAIKKNGGKPNPYIVKLRMFDSHGLDMRFIENALTNSERVYIEWVKAFCEEDPYGLHQIACETVHEFLEDCSYNNCSRHCIDYGNNKYLGHISKPIGTIYLFYQDAEGPKIEEEMILIRRYVDKNSSKPSPAQKEDNERDDIPF